MIDAALAGALLARARAVREAPAGPVPSPCTSVCRVDEPTGYCEGCLRTLDEIIDWGTLPDPQRRVIWARLAQRAEEFA